MGHETPVKWFVIFVSEDADETEESEQGKFPQTEFWQPDRQSAQEEAKRVLKELRGNGDTRIWKAVGHPDPFEVAKGRSPIDQWIISTEDLHAEGRPA